MATVESSDLDISPEVPESKKESVLKAEALFKSFCSAFDGAPTFLEETVLYTSQTEGPVGAHWDSTKYDYTPPAVAWKSRPISTTCNDGCLNDPKTGTWKGRPCFLLRVEPGVRALPMLIDCAVKKRQPSYSEVVLPPGTNYALTGEKVVEDKVEMAVVRVTPSAVSPSEYVAHMRLTDYNDILAQWMISIRSNFTKARTVDAEKCITAPFDADRCRDIVAQGRVHLRSLPEKTFRDYLSYAMCMSDLFKMVAEVWGDLCASNGAYCRQFPRPVHDSGYMRKM